MEIKKKWTQHNNVFDIKRNSLKTVIFAALKVTWQRIASCNTNMLYIDNALLIY